MARWCTVVQKLSNRPIRSSHQFQLASPLSRRHFLSLFAAGAAAACGRDSVAGAGPAIAAAVGGQAGVVRQSMLFTKDEEASGIFKEVRLALTLIRADGSVTELIDIQNTWEAIDPKGVTHAVGVGTALLGVGAKVAGSQQVRPGRTALLQDGGLASWHVAGKEVALLDAAAVRRAFDGRSILQIDDGVVLLSDGTIDRSLRERLGGQKPVEGPMLNGSDKTTLKNVRRVKDVLLFGGDGRLLEMRGGMAWPTRGIKEGEHILDACFIHDTAYATLSVTESGLIVAQAREGTITLEGPKDPVRIEAGAGTVVVITRGGNVWEVNVDLSRKQPPFQVKGLDGVVAVVAAPMEGAGAALRRDGTVWVWQLDRPVDHLPQQVADGILVPA
jgi:hypothetical protein